MLGDAKSGSKTDGRRSGDQNIASFDDYVFGNHFNCGNTGCLKLQQRNVKI